MFYGELCAKLLVGLLSALLSASALAQKADQKIDQKSGSHLSEYYSPGLWQAMQNRTLANDELRTALLSAISKGHHAVGYDEARRQIFGKVDLQNNGREFFVKDVYCEQDYSHSLYPSLDFAPNTYPKNGDIINTEHTWPQSRFTKRYPNDFQKSDIHHLYPSDSKMNSHRSSLHFGEVVEKIEDLKCNTASLGHSADNAEIVFEPPRDHKGNVARAIFYFATRYEMKISDNEEKYLRQWNHDDPVDQNEISRNNQIEEIQGNRNPFIDVPELIDQIHNF